MFTVKRCAMWFQHQPHPPGVDRVSWLAAWRGQGETSRPPRSVSVHSTMFAQHQNHLTTYFSELISLLGEN